MKSKPRISLLVAAVLLAGCVDSGGDDVASSPAAAPTTAAPEVTLSPSSEPPISTTVADPTTLAPEVGVFRIAPVGETPGLAILYGAHGVFHSGHTGFGTTPVVEGPVSAAVDTFESGIVYQRPGDQRRAFVWRDGEDKELLVAAENQTIHLVGVRVDPADGSFHVLYTRRTSALPETTVETLRSYNMSTGEVTEIYQSGGWESGTRFSFIEGDLAVGRWGGEGYTRTDLVNVATGEIKQRIPADRECFDGEQAEDCLPFWVATLSGDTIYGFGPRPSSSGLVDSMALYEYDLGTSELTELKSFPWDNGLYYPVEIWAGPGLVIGLSSAPSLEVDSLLPALIYDISTGEATTAPVSGIFRSAFIS